MGQRRSSGRREGGSAKRLNCFGAKVGVQAQRVASLGFIVASRRAPLSSSSVNCCRGLQSLKLFLDRSWGQIVPWSGGRLDRPIKRPAQAAGSGVRSPVSPGAIHMSVDGRMRRAQIIQNSHGIPSRPPSSVPLNGVWMRCTKYYACCRNIESIRRNLTPNGIFKCPYGRKI